MNEHESTAFVSGVALGVMLCIGLYFAASPKSPAHDLALGQSVAAAQREQQK